MWIARNKDGSFSLSDTRLIRGHIFGTCQIDNNGNPIENYWVCLDGSTPSPLYLNIFPNLSWEDEPLEVNLVAVPPQNVNLDYEVAKELYSELPDKNGLTGLSLKNRIDSYEKS